jgi:hypothetical protein
MEQNKTGRYFKYAIGEIILVVIGILIALQINNWNNQNQNLRKEQEILKNLKAEFQQNLDELNRDHKINQEALAASYQLLTIDKVKKVDPQLIDNLLGTAYDFATFDARVGVVNDVIASGKLELIRDPELRLILNQWTGELNDYIEDVIIRRNFWSNNFDILNRHIPHRNTDASSDRPDYSRPYKIEPIEVPQENYQNFINDLTVDGALFSHYYNQSFVTSNEKEIKKFLEKIIDLINMNIN